MELNFIVTVLALVAVTLDSTDQTPVRSRAGTFFSRLNVYATSFAVSGVPSLNLTPDRMVNVSDLFPSPHAYDVASMGVVLAFCSGLMYTSGS